MYDSHFLSKNNNSHVTENFYLKSHNLVEYSYDLNLHSDSRADNDIV